MNNNETKNNETVKNTEQTNQTTQDFPKEKEPVKEETVQENTPESQPATEAKKEEIPENKDDAAYEYSSLDVDLLQKRVAELETKLLTAQAELVNYRKRKDEETSNLLKFANQDIITETIGVLDNFERAMKSAGTSENAELQKFSQGIGMIYNQMKDILKKYGVEEIECLDKPFDHNTCDALMIGEVKDKPNDIVLEVFMKGYTLKGRVIRPAKVRVNQVKTK